MNHRATRPYSNPSRQSFSAFTLIELLVVVGIIAVLVAILVPTVSKIRIAAQSASTKNFIVQLTGVISQYEQDFHAYPGPLSYAQVMSATSGIILPTAAVTGFDISSNNVGKITMSENLVLGLLGGLRNTGTTSAPVFSYDPTLVGQGANSLNLLSPKRYKQYGDSVNLSWRDTASGKTGHYQDDAGAADDTMIPEYVDAFADPMPILYFRARKGASTTGTTSQDNPVFTDNTPAIPLRSGVYDLSQNIAYTGVNAGKTIGVGKHIKVSAYKPTAPTTPPFPHGLNTVTPTASLSPQNTANYVYPYDAYPYFSSPSQPNTARNPDSYILISAGPDRVYGTADDITSFGDVAP